MKFINLLAKPARSVAFAVLLLAGPIAGAAFIQPKKIHRHHFDLEMTGAEYARILNEHPQSNLTADPLDPILAVGSRNLALLVEVNSHRDSAHQISLSSKETEAGFPMNAPREINEKISLAEFANLMANMPLTIRSILTSTDPLPATLPVSDQEYIDWGFKTDRVYQMTVRWIMERDNLADYALERQNDVRGVYNLDHTAGIENQLRSWPTLAPATQALYRDWLIGICGNTDERDGCGARLDDAISTGTVWNFWSRYISASRVLYSHFFKMQWSRQDIVLSSTDPTKLTIPFVDPHSPVVASYLQDNIEDEWKWKNWNLRMIFQAGDKNLMSHLEFQKAVVPHVQGPNTIVIDENQPITEYDSRWMIRHEFGHILGFPDCYVEFYDTDREAMVSYQLDTTNLMCSRQGQFKQIHFDELKRVYFR